MGNNELECMALPVAVYFTSKTPRGRNIIYDFQRARSEIWGGYDSPF